MQLVIGNKNYSSWSLRPWLLLTANNISFDEIHISLSVNDTRQQILQYSGAARVPVLIDNKAVIWDSLAICEYISEQYLDNRGWPSSSALRAIARSVCAEMHSSFYALREQMPMNCRAKNRVVNIEGDLAEDISRIDNLWTQLLNEHQGPYLFGKFCIADCMFAPVVFRFNTYNVALSAAAQSYCEHILSHPAMQRWAQQAAAETLSIKAEERG